MNPNNITVASREHLADISTFKKTSEEKELAKHLKKQFKAKKNESATIKPVKSGQS